MDHDAGDRLDRWLARRLIDCTRNQIQKHLAEGDVRVNGAPQPARYKVQAGDRIEAQWPEADIVTIEPEPIALDIVYEDEHLLMLNKPAGLVTHPGPGHTTGTLVHALLNHCGPGLREVGEEGRWGIVHRLDSGTSGLMLAARTPACHAALVEAMAGRTIRRGYMGLAVGGFPAGEGEVDRPIGRRPGQRKLMGVVADGREARTDWRVLYEAHGVSLVALALHTGRTHQIRVHLQSIGKPILGDADYGWTKSRVLQSAPQGSRPLLARHWPERPMLHAARLSLMHPITRELLELTAEPPADMAAVLDGVFGEAWLAPWEESLARDLAGAREAIRLEAEAGPDQA